MPVADASVELSALARSKSAYEAYSVATLDAFAQLGRRMREIDDRVRQEISSRRHTLAVAEAALAACRSRENASCGLEEANVRRAQERLERAVTSSRQIDVAASRWMLTQRRFSDNVSRLVFEGQSFISVRERAIQDYLQRGGGQQPSAANASSPPRGPVSTGAAGLARAPGLPEKYALVPLTMIDDSDSAITGPESFKKGYTPEDLRWAFTAFDEVILPALGRSVDSDYFRDRDNREGRQGTRSYADTNSGFLHDDHAIHLDRRADGRFTVGNGYHRIWLARQLGRTHVPARIE